MSVNSHLLGDSATDEPGETSEKTSPHTALPIVNNDELFNVRLNSAIGYIPPKDMLAGHKQEIQAERDRKLGAAKEQRKNRRR
jgi:hypothetical protein